MISVCKSARAALVVTVLFAVVGCAKKVEKEDTSLNQPPPDSEAAAELPAGPPVVRSSGGGEGGEAAADVAADSDQPFVTRAELNGFLDRGPSYILRIVTVEPKHGEKGFEGFQITEVTPAARTFMTPHVRVGDVVTHVNGVRVLKPEDLMQAWRSLDRVSTIRVDFTRRSEAMHAAWIVRP
jgi:S1-C subfamily serine protease